MKGMNLGDGYPPGGLEGNMEKGAKEANKSVGISNPSDKGKKGSTGFTLRLLYLFAGAERQTSVVAVLRKMCSSKGWQLDATEIDIKRDKMHDLSREEFQKDILSRIALGEFDVVVCTPPCSTWSRVRLANLRGPPPLRSKGHLWGFPWIKGRYLHDLELGNDLVKFSIQVWTTVKDHPISKQGLLIFLFGEHPEDLGLVIREEDGLQIMPASIWQIQQLRAVVDALGSKVGTVAISQCCWGAQWRKPTRLISTSKKVLSWGPNGWPKFSQDGSYSGPLDRSCNCKVTTSLVRRKSDQEFRTTGTDVYPPELDEAIADAMIHHFSEQRPEPSGDGDGGSGADISSEVDKAVELQQGKVSEDALEPKCNSQSAIGWEEEEWGTDPREGIPGEGEPLRCYYKGKHRTVHDGGGLCSPGRWPVEQRKPLDSYEGVRLASKCKRMFLSWMMSRDQEGKSRAQEVFWKLASGQARSSPFEEEMGGFRRELDAELKDMGFDPFRRDGDRVTEVNFRRLKAMLEAIGDVDHEWLAEVASEGVGLGVDETMPRVPSVFEEKTKWNLSQTDEEFRDVFADNYKSAEENALDIERQVMEEVNKGSIIMMRNDDAEKRFGGRLAVAALGAVPKELGSSVVRIVHDGSYSVDVNHRIKVRDRLRFPSIDDAAGVLLHLEDETVAGRASTRFSLLYDVSGAHKLLPVKESDWGYQSFRLPGEKYIRSRCFFTPEARLALPQRPTGGSVWLLVVYVWGIG